MRQHKFRAWDKKRKTMNYQKSDHPTFGDHSFDFGDLFYYSKNELVAMQYTGLKDKNGKEIYEGDIVSGKQYSKKVVYNEERTTFMLLFYYENRWLRDNLSEEVSTGAEVIGNIYENKELLEGK